VWPDDSLNAWRNAAHKINQPTNQPPPQALAAAQSSATDAVSRASGNEGRLEELTALVEGRTREVEAATARAVAAERALQESTKERDALEKKVARLERAKDEQARGEGGGGGVGVLGWFG
jgi:hypothetical protein